MPTTWLLQRQASCGVKPRIRDQLINLDEKMLILRNPWIKDSIFMGKMYTAGIWVLATLIYPDLFNIDYRNQEKTDIYFLTITLLTPFWILPFLIYRIILIKKLSNILMNRKTKKIKCTIFGKTHTFDWNHTEGGVFSYSVFGGASVSTSYALAFGTRREDGTFGKRPDFWIDSNEPADPGLRHVAEVWEYIRQFMEHGPDKLPPPAEPSWLHAPLHQVYLTPAEAWRHYAPWRTGEPGEMQGKKNWMLPVWLVLFPYNFTTAVCWYAICRLFRVSHPVAPIEVLQDDDSK